MSSLLNSKAPSGVAPALPPFLLDRSPSIILFGGKGGVGKTTCAAATALWLAQQRCGEQFLLVSIDPAHSLEDSFAGSDAPSNLTLSELDAQARLREFKSNHAGHLRQVAERGTFFDREDIGQLLELSMPGLDEVMAFNSVAQVVQSNEYSCVIVDGAPTGHALRFLELPELMRNWVGALDAMLAKHRYMARLYGGTYQRDEADAFLQDLSARIERLQSMLMDADNCRCVPVVTPDLLSVPETRNLIRGLERLDIPVRDIVINRLHPPGNHCELCRATRAAQSTPVQQIVGAFSERYDLWSIPRMGAQVQGTEQLCRFWQKTLSEPKWAPPGLPPASLPVKVENPARRPNDQRSLLLFAGKGGVGKTTLGCATALRLAEDPGVGDVCILSTDPAHSLSACLGVPVGAEPTEVCDGLSAMELDATAEFRELKELYAREVQEAFLSLTANGRFDFEFDRQVIEGVLDLTPAGLDEVMALSSVIELMEQKKHEKFILDTAPTGHLVRLLELPELIEQWLRVIFGLLLKYKRFLSLPGVSDFLVAISRRIKKFRALLTNPDAACLHVVSILSEMALEETLDLVEACRRATISVPVLFLNKATRRGGCPACHAIAREQSQMRDLFDSRLPDMHHTLLYRCGELIGEENLTQLGRLLYR